MPQQTILEQLYSYVFFHPLHGNQAVGWHKSDIQHLTGSFLLAELAFTISSTMLERWPSTIDTDHKSLTYALVNLPDGWTKGIGPSMSLAWPG
jgi:hypothetical protein